MALPSPSEASPPATAFHLGPWLVSPPLLEIRDGKQVRRLGVKVMAVLVALARQAGRVVTKDGLIAEVWAGAFTSDEAVAAVIYELRKGLGDDAREPRFVETIRGSGYRLVVEPAFLLPESLGPASSRPQAPAPDSPAVVNTAPTPAPGTAGRSWRRSRGWLWALVVALFLAGSMVAILLPREGTGRGPELAAPIRSLAVLPVSNFAAATSELGLADALADMLVADLDRMCPVDIASGLSVRGGPRRWSLDEVTAQLGVDAIVESSVLRSGDRVWIAVQLVETESGRLLWSRSYDRQGSDDLAILREVALDVASEVRARLPAEADDDPTGQP